MNLFFKTTLILIIGIFMSTASFSQIDYSLKLKKDLVTIEAGKYKLNDFLFLSYSDGKTAQVKMSAICPIDVMSRDNFIAIYNSFGIVSLLGILGIDENEFPEIKDLDELIGDPDLTINFVMTKNGIQTQLITADGRNNVTTTWDEFFK